MKLKTYIYTLILLFVGLSSCNDAIEITQPGRLSADKAFQSVEDLKLGLFSAYDIPDVTHEITFASTFTDEISIGFDNGGQGLGDGRYGFILNSTSTAPANIWINNYALINSVNRLIEGADLITPTASEQAEYDNILGQAYALRAYAHFQLFSYFTTDYTDGTALSAIALDYVPTIDQELGRSTNAEVVAQITADLNQANSLMNDDTSDPFFLNKDVVMAMRARLAAYTGDYAAAKTLANDLLTKYPLTDQTTYLEMFDDENQAECIFLLQRTIGDDHDTQATGGGGWVGALYAFVNATITGSPYFEMGRALFNELQDGDIRYNVLVDDTSLIDSEYPNSSNFKDNDVLVISKYSGSEGQPLMNDLKVFRSAEMLFLVAEAEADAGNFSEVARLLAMLRTARFGSDQPELTLNSQAEAFGAILDERRIELAFEGHRWKDLKRLGIRAGRSVNRDPLDCAVNGACNIASDDYRFTLPIPLAEMNGNSVIREQQNPGY